MIELKRLAILRALAHYGSVTAAARALTYSPSAVSQQLAALERDLDVQLVHRTGRRITMTAAGRELAQRAALMLELAEEFQARARHTVAPPAPLRIAAFPGAVEWLIAPAIGRAAGAAVRADLNVVDPDTAVRLVRHGLADLAVVYQQGHGSVPAMRAERLVDAPLRIVASIALGYPPPTVASAGNLPWILPAEGTVARKATDDALAAAGISPRVAATGSTLHAVAALVASGAGIALLPDFATAPLADALFGREPSDVRPSLSVWLVRPTTCSEPAVDAVTEAITGQARATGPGPLPRRPPRATAGTTSFPRQKVINSLDPLGRTLPL